VAGVIAALVIVPESRDPKPGRVDVVGVLLSVVGLVVLVYGVVDGGDHGFGRPAAWGSILGGLVILAGFVAYERRIPFPSLDVRLFANPRFSAAVVAVGLVFFAAMGSMFFTAFYLQLVRGYSPLKSGLLMVPFAVAQMVFAPRSAALVRRYGPRAVMAVGMILTMAALGGFVLVTVDTPAWAVAALAFVQGVGMANVMPPATESIMSSLPREKAGVGSAVSNTIRQVAGALGVAVLGSVLSATYRSNMAPHVTRLPGSVRGPAQESISGGYAVAARLGAAGRTLIGHINDSFVQAMHYAAVGSAAVALAGLVVVFVWLPRHSASAVFMTAEATAAGETVTEGTPDGRELADVA
jgi:DHA2 family multidrug resistance protein-like MFS transporter